MALSVHGYTGKISHLQATSISLVTLLCLSGCKGTNTPPANDANLTSSIQAQLAADTSLSGQPIQASVQNAAVTLSGTVNNDAQRTIAARDAAAVSGVRQVVNNLSVVTPPPVSASVVPPPIDPVPLITKKAPAVIAPVRTSGRAANGRDRSVRDQGAASNSSAPIERPDTRAQAGTNPAPTPQTAPQAAQPSLRSVTIPSGSSLSVRITQTLDSASTQEGASFSGTVATDLISDGLVAIPAGSAVSGRVDAVHEAGHFSGASLLTVSLSSISRKGERIPVTSEPYSVEGKGRGKNTAVKAGGGAAVGAVLGGIFGGGKGAAIGAATGGGLGAGSNAITRGQQVQIPSESIVRFRINSPITVRVRGDATGVSQDAGSDNQDPTLKRHPNQ